MRIVRDKLMITIHTAFYRSIDDTPTRISDFLVSTLVGHSPILARIILLTVQNLSVFRSVTARAARPIGIPTPREPRPAFPRVGRRATVPRPVQCLTPDDQRPHHGRVSRLDT